MKKILFIIPFIFFTVWVKSQPRWSSDSTPFGSIDWYNYATSYAGNDDQSPTPTIVTAIPYNGVYTYFDNGISNTNFSIDSSLFCFTPSLIENSRQYDTYDSAAIYFLVPGIFSANASEYEYRLLLNGKEIIKPWTAITQFADTGFQLNAFKKGMAFLGGYRTVWGNFLVAQVRKKNSRDILSFSVVNWQPVKPVILNIYKADELNGFLARLKKNYDYSLSSKEKKKWQSQYKPEEIDSFTFLPRKLILPETDDNIVFFLQSDIYKKEALEYQLVKNDMIYTGWRPNDFDNNLIWLKNLHPGEYILQIRYRSQRHNITSYPFYIEPAWYRHPLLKIGIGALAGFILFLLFRFWNQKKNIVAEKLKKEKLALELKALRAQLNPHFIFNALSSIQGLVNKNDIAGANHYLTEFSSLLRESLKNKDAEYLPLDKELQLLETYLRLEQMRFRFQYTITVSGNITSSEIEIPSLLIQPLVENAIKHGAGPKNENGSIQIRVFAEQKNLVITIADNGTGFSISGSSKGYGLLLVKERIELLNKSLHSQQIDLSIESNTGSPTTARFTFVNWL